MRKRIIISTALGVMLASGAAFAADGKAIYDQACMACHAQGVAGAPKFGDSEAWAERIAKGMDVLYENSIKGFQGEAGVMPPKGGFANLSDEEVNAAVDYMVENAE